MATIYTRVECKWDGVTQEYVVNEKQGFEYNGPILFAKKKLRKILGIVATIAIAAFAPQALGISQTMAGALGGAVGGGISGGGRGAILGAITGGIGGYGVENGWWGGAGATGLEGGGSGGSSGLVGYDSAGNWTGTTAGGESIFANTPVQETVAGATTASAPDAVVSGTGDSGAAMSGYDSNGNWTGTDSGGGSIFENAGGTSQNPQQTVGLQATGDYNMPGYDSNGNWTGTDSSGKSIFENSDGTSVVQNTQQPGFFDNMSPTFQKAGLELGKQALGSFLTGATEPSYMKDYAKTMRDVSDRNMQISDYNMTMANKKAAVGDQLYGDAMAMSPDYFAEQQRRQRQTMDANAWGDAEQRLRAQGKDDNYINNERRRFDIATSQNQGTMYDFGWQAGMNARNNTFSTAGGMYGGVGYMGDPTGGMYQSYAQANQQRAAGIGRGIDAVFNADKQNQTGTENTRDKDKNMGVNGSIFG